MPDANTMWTLAITVALAVSTGCAFLAWNAPDLWVRFCIAAYGALIAIGIALFSYNAGIEAGLNSALSLTKGKGYALLQKAADRSGPPEWSVWAINVALVVLIIFTLVAGYRSNQRRNAEK